ncbi:MAG: membrane protein insertion efficiency factor YidD [Flavobacteriales bacterium]|nr:membrane protein insertion efficiency factor YidD [Flavobacteriales bacterium]
MKLILLGTIRLYWTVFPKHKRRPCVFEDSCSNYIYRVTNEKGFFSGLSALKKRFYQCRPGYTIYKDEQNNSFELCLKDGSIITNEKISRTLLPPFNYNYNIKK